MTDIALHRRCMSQPVRERRILSAKIKHWVTNLHGNGYIAPELVEEVLDMRLALPDKAKTLGAGTLPNESPISRAAYWTKFCECWASMGSRI